jgi:Cd2+/Zn2+-exporting ATPase
MSREPNKHEHTAACGCSHDQHSQESSCAVSEHQQDPHSCGCGHEHHAHEHHGHQHDDSCGCGHEHHEHEHHGHQHEHSCGCGHEHPIAETYRLCTVCGLPMDQCTCYLSQDTANKQIFLLENLGCANCAAKMEQKIKELPEVEDAVIIYATKQLRVTSTNFKGLLPKLQEICSSIEAEVVVTPKEAATALPKAAGKKTSENRRDRMEIGIGAVLFAAGLLLQSSYPAASIAALLLSYLALGGRIVLTALKNLRRGQIFDENFLMSIATLAAIAIADYKEAVGVMLFYRIGELFEHIAVERSRTQIMDAVDMRPEVVNLQLQNGEVQTIPAQEAQPGDILLVRPGDRIPLDGIVTEGESRIDTSPVTGEPVPVKAELGSEVISGCVNTSGQLKIRVAKPLEESMVTRILDSVENAAASKPKIDRFITKFARIYTPLVVGLALGTAIIPSLFTGNWNHWIYTAITFLVISCPCALVLSVPLAFFSGIGAGSKKGILFKGGVSLEAMKNVKAIVMDKTGTITQGNFVLQKAVVLGDVTEDELLTLSASCELSSTHPIGVSIVTAAKERNLSVARPEAVKEISGKGIMASLPQGKVLCGNRKLMEAYQVDVSGYVQEDYGTEVLTALNGRLIGYLVIADTIKEEAGESIRALKRYHITTAMLTGDSQQSADAVARATGIDEVHAKLLPQDKLSRLQEIRQKHGAVMFVGDGINDAPVLAGADVGAAMGSGADAAIEAADVVFMTSSMEAIPQSIAIAKATGTIAVQNVVFALAIKVLVMILGLAGFANMWMAVFADTGVAMLCVLNAIRILYKK